MKKIDRIFGGRRNGASVTAGPLAEEPACEGVNSTRALCKVNRKKFV